ncbi:MAG: glycosyltransferase family 2 protein [Candidatus Magasanikbacteria bacterium]
MKDLTIAFVNYKMKDDVIKAIDSILDDIEGCDYDIQINVADNSQNEDGLKDEMEEKFPQDNVKYIDSGGNVGFGAGNNIAFQETPARYYFALNCDTVIPKDSNTIERIIEFMDDNPKIGCIGPRLENMDGSLQYSCFRFDLPSILIKPLKKAGLHKKWDWVKKYTDNLLMKDFDHSETMPVDWVLGAAMVVRKEAVDDVGWFDERYFMYIEDADWCHEMWEAGWPVYYVPDIVIRHRHERGSDKVPGIIKALVKNKLARIHLASWLKYLWKWRGNHKYYAR